VIARIRRIPPPRPLISTIAWTLIVAANATSVLAAGSAIDGLAPREFKFGAVAIGQAKDVDYARAEGLGLVPAPAFHAYLNGVLGKLLAQSPVRNVPAKVYVRASGDWAAKTTADANIYVALGTLLRLDDEDEVAALLAHEAAHVILGHANADIVQDVQQRAIQVSTLALDTRDFVQGVKSGMPRTGSDKAGVKEQSRALLLNTMLVAPAWTREQERDADLLGVDLLVRTGYSPSAMTSLLAKQKSFETERAADPETAALDKQLAAFGIDVNAMAAEQTTKATDPGGVAGQGLGAIAGSAIGSALSWGSRQLAAAGKSHPKTEDRIDDTKDYIKSRYADAAKKTPQVEAWDAAKEAGGTIDVLEGYIAAIEAKGALADGNVTSAGKLVKPSLAGVTRAHAYPNYVDAAVQVASGASAAAIADYERVLGGPEPAGAIYSEAAALYLRTGNREKARATIEKGYARMKEPPSLTVPLIRTYRELGLQASADKIALQCAARWPKMQALCSQEARGQ
jgi:predicted Zn-dependent protease